jgi:hypothetical protein
MKLKTVGYYKEMPQGRETDPTIFDYINNKSLDNIDKICEYLDQGVTFITSPGTVEDVICPENGVIGTSNALTDGVWLWPEALSYYVKKYALILPDDFIETMKAHNWKVLFDLDKADCDDIEIDGIAII